MRQSICASCAVETEVGKALLEPLVISESVEDHSSVSVLREPWRISAEQKFGHKRTNETEIDFEGTQAAYKIGQNGDDERINPHHRRVTEATTSPLLRVLALSRGTSVRHTPGGRVQRVGDL